MHRNDPSHPLSPSNSGPNTQPAIRCAIYTRKSTDENLDSSYNSLDAQREACEHYIQSQAHQNWQAVPTLYDDGGFSGGTINRPAFKRLLQDVQAGEIDRIVIYKIDRLSRSLIDFTKIFQFLEDHSCGIVSVTQQLDTTSSTGRLTTNMLLSFAQFEREVAAERIRDKIAGAKRRGKWTGGTPPLGYDIDRKEKRLVVNPAEAVTVRMIFRRYAQLGSVTELVRELNGQGLTTKSWTTKAGKVRPGRPWTKNHVYKLLRNPTYAGNIRHRDKVYEGEHDAIIEGSLFRAVQEQLDGNARPGQKRRGRPPGADSSLLSGLLFCGSCGSSMGISWTKNHGRKYRYYVCLHGRKSGAGESSCTVRSVPAGEVERTVLDQVKHVLTDRTVIRRAVTLIKKREAAEKKGLKKEIAELEKELGTVQTAADQLVGSGDNALPRDYARDELAGLDAQVENLVTRIEIRRAEIDLFQTDPTEAAHVEEHLHALHNLWSELFPGEKGRIVRLLIERIVIHEGSIDLALRTDGVKSLATEMAGAPHA